MSRSQPNQNTPNPATRWFEWDGANGHPRYYDKEKKVNVDVPLPFQFILLDELATIGGWHEVSQSGIYANEVRDTRQDVFVVKAFKGGTLAEGLYQTIKDRITSRSVGARFMAHLYIAYKADDGTLKIGSLKFKGGALGAWMDFRKDHRSDLYTDAIEIHGFTQGRKGKVDFRNPDFRFKPLSEASNGAATKLDQDLQLFLKDYFSRTKKDQVEVAPEPPDDVQDDIEYAMPSHPNDIAPDESEVPF